MAKITYIEFDDTRHEVEVENGKSLMEGAVDNMIDGIIAECGGNCNCATCHVYIAEEWIAKLPTPQEAEKDLLEGAAEPQENSRLSCQIEVTDELDGLVLTIPEFQF